MLKWLVSLALCASFANSSMLENFLQKSYTKNEKFDVRSVKQVKILELKNGFKAHFFELELEFKPLKKVIRKNEVLFVKDEIFTNDIIDVSAKTSMRDELLGEKVSIIYKRVKDENTQNCN
ncbi:hypothetical protein [Campylobacter suis]|uniref:Flagella basal body P-ring formation protein FlgA n=1 Tax=Campylobacter suis TaxID=2790657 RepID=A0ABM8Q1C6_9BACT|nr:hypothetical protein [Campylobacter suis]CAD7286629.1 hypothetical protein LMG8286_00458 [Campylobacter suis]